MLDHRVTVARARRFLAAHVSDDVQLAAVARASGTSRFHLARLYRAITGETVGQARRRLRLERAAARLTDAPTRSVSAIGLEVGFATPSAFARAFRAALGQSPTAYRAAAPDARREALRALAAAAPGPPAYTLRGPRIVRRGDVRVVHVREHGAYSEVAAPLAFARLEHALAGTALVRCPRIAASYDDPATVVSERLRFDAGVIAPAHAVVPPGTRVAIWEGGAFAVFEMRGDYRHITDAFRRIVAAWPGYRLRQRPAPYLELYRSGPDAVPVSRLVTELWIPIEGGSDAP